MPPWHAGFIYVHSQEVIMKCNVGGLDRTSRIVTGAVLLIVGFSAPIPMPWRILVLVVALIALVTALARYCPVNSLFGIDTSDAKIDDGSAH